MIKRDLAHNFGLILKDKRNQVGISQDELANITNLDRTYISQLERGKKMPTIQTVFSLCEALNVVPQEMMEALSFSLNPQEQEKEPPPTLLQIFGTGISCGRPLTPDYVVEDKLVVDDLLVQNKEKTFFVKASGDSMFPNIQDGDYLVVDVSKSPANGEVVLLQLENEFTIKRFYKTRGEISLKCDNPRYKDLNFKSNETLLCIGVVTASIRLSP